MSELHLPSGFGEICVIDEPKYSFGSADNVRAYPAEINLGHDGINSCCGVMIDGVASVVLAAGGGATRVHPNSAVILGDNLFVAVGDKVISLSLPLAKTQWIATVDTATCFGLHLSPDEALICHGECEITRLSRAGEIVWQRSGSDIFTGNFELQPACIVVHDFAGHPYRFDYATGADV